MTEIDYLIKQIDESHDRILTDLGSGKAHDHAEYRHTCGVLAGLLRAKTMIIDLKERIDNSDE